MTRPLEPAEVSAVLNVLEDVELRLLVWGVTNGSLAHDEALNIIDQAVADLDPTPAVIPPADSVLRMLLRRALLTVVPGLSPPRYRTRLAEAVRLVASLRQLFPPRGFHDVDQLQEGWWHQSPSLVADYRLHVRPRLYPRRDIPAGTALQELQQLDGWGALQSAVAAAQIGDRELAAFQLAASRTIFTSLATGAGRGMIVGAGTGSGKTLAFYLPAFAAMADHARPRQYQLRTLALYPRKELLRDQLRDAVVTARLVAKELRAVGHRPLRIGALYAATPTNDTDRSFGIEGSWRRHDKGLICPYFACPGADAPTGPECHGDLVWWDADRRQHRERLRCNVCGLTFDDEIALTRDSMRNRPPDLLFTTTEMLNRTASSRLGRMMGWQGAPAPNLVLLDEVHTYAGIHGAQVALLLRRWRNDVKTPVTFVGLSATLRDAGTFFAQLTGLDEARVDHVAPTADELRPEGREYAIALRGDPVSGTSLLSTSIQAAMLFGRVLDRDSDQYLYGSTGFIFTDDLDVTNRFYDNLRDAEGQQDRAGRGGGRVLAALRSPDAPWASQRHRDGQSWDLVQQIGRPLPPHADGGELRIGRTSSQDAGVDLDADLIVSTPSLEVGYNDTRVGLVIQHKAPRDAAAFIQRRGRAGRTRIMRPWTVIALSDYGRDRLAYQAYETLFDPEVPARTLPIGNRFVLKIQGAQALLDWLARKLVESRGRPADPRTILRTPVDARRGNPEDMDALAALLEDTLINSALQDELGAHLRRALAISAEQAQALLWEQPRALLLAVVPTALRRLRSRWDPVMPDPGAKAGDLLPEYLTSTLFFPLNVPEVWFVLPFGQVERESLPVEQALREAVPGRVSRRYGHRRDGDRTWLPLPPSNTPGVLDVATIVDAGLRRGRWQAPGSPPVEVLRPLRIRLAQPPDEVTSVAQGIPRWASQIVEPPAGLYDGDVPRLSTWGRQISSIGFATHAAGNPAQFRRMTTGADCETTYRNRPAERSTVRYILDGAPAALGFDLTADAIRFTIAPLDLADDPVAGHLSSPAWRTLAFRTAVAEDPALDAVANTFQRGWLTLVYLTAFALAGMGGTRPASDVHADLANGAWRDELPAVLRALYRDVTDGQAPTRERLIPALTELSHNRTVTECLDHHGQLLWATDVATRTADLAQRAYVDTIAAAILAAAQRACPDAQDRDLIIDVLPPEPGAAATIWLSETAIGGLGIIEQLVQYYAQDPRRFWGLVESALQPGDHEYVDVALTRLLTHLEQQPTGAAAHAIMNLRSARSARHADDALDALRRAWANLDGQPRHAAIAALSTRLLRPGSDEETDRTTLAIVRAWDDLQERLGFEVDAQVIAYAVGTGRLSVATARPPSVDQVFSMLWPRGSTARTQHLQHYQPYAPNPVLDRLLAVAVHGHRLPVIDVTAADWQTAYGAAMVEHGAVELRASADQGAALAQALRLVPVLEVDRDVLRVYGEVRKILRSGPHLRARIEIREAVQ